jgi:hypothetical protein
MSFDERMVKWTVVQLYNEIQLTKKWNKQLLGAMYYLDKSLENYGE